MTTTNRNVRRNGTRPRGRPTSNSAILKPGLSIWSGQIKEEYLQALKPWSKAIKVYHEMQDDVVIGALFESVQTPLLASPFEITPGGDSSEDLKAVDFLEKNLLKNPHFEWSSHVEDMLEFLSIGFALSEKVLEKQSDGLLHLRDLIPIGQDSLYKWGDPDEFGLVTSFQQRVDSHTHTAPMDKLLHFKFKGKHRDPQGRGILRSLYRPWFFKKNLEALEAIGVERDVGNAPVATLKEGVRYSQADLDKLQAALEGFRMDEALYVILPGGIELKPYAGGNKVYDTRLIIRDWQHLIRQRFFADFLSLGSESVGTQALAREMTTFFGLALRAIQEIMLSVWNRQLIPWLFKWNNWELENPPTLGWLKPGETNIQSLAQSYTMLVDSQLIDVNDPELRSKIRGQLGLRKKNIPDEKVIAQPRPMRALPGVDNNSRASEFRFADLEGSELVETIVEFIDSIIGSVLKGTQDVDVGISEISQLHSDVINMERNNRTTKEEKSTISHKVSDGINILVAKSNITL